MPFRVLPVASQPTVSVACADAFVPFGPPGGAGLSIVMFLSSTVAAFPAASITLTTRWCSPLLTSVVSNPTSALTDAGHGWTYRNAASPSVV